MSDQYDADIVAQYDRSFTETPFAGMLNFLRFIRFSATSPVYSPSISPVEPAIMRRSCGGAGLPASWEWIFQKR
jgi:hypothetical protein